MSAEKKGELLALLIGFFISLAFTIFTILKMIELSTIQQDISEYLGIPIHDPYIPIFILLSLVPTLYLLVRIIKISSEMNRAARAMQRESSQKPIIVEVSEKRPARASLVEKVSNAWYLAPLFFGIIGGLIAWFVNKGRNPSKARNFLRFGMLCPFVLVLWIIIVWVAITALIF